VKRFSCAEMGELITDYLDDALDDAARQGFEAHRDTCESCRCHIGEFRTTITMLGELPRERLSDDVHGRLIARFRHRPRA
jgi:anti-sigma factor RsiW